MKAVAAVDRALTRRRVRTYSILALLVTLGLWLVALLEGHWPFDVFKNVVLVDLSAMLAAGEIARRGDFGRLYDVGYQTQVRALLVGANPVHLETFQLPPFVAFLYTPFAVLPYWLACALWTLLTCLLLLSSFRLLWPLVPGVHRFGYALVLLVFVASFPVAETILSGEDGAVSLFLIAAGLRLLLAGWDVAAGAVLGFGIYKPQIFLLIPVFLLVQRRWTALAAWTGVAGALAISSLLLVGLDGARAYVALLSADTIVGGKLDRLLWWKLETVPAIARAFLPGTVGLPLSFVAVAVGIVLVVRSPSARRATKEPRHLVSTYAYTIAVAGLVSPQLFAYDCLILLIPSLVALDLAPSSRAVRVGLAFGFVVTWLSALRFYLTGGLPWPLWLLGVPLLPVTVAILVHALFDRESALRA